MDERSGLVGRGGVLGGHIGSVQEWRDPSTWLSASAAAAGEGRGADKVRAPAESIEAAALRLSAGGGRRDRARNHRNTFSRRRKNEG